MSSHRIRIAAPVRVLAALMTLGIMTSCHSGGGGGCLTENCVSVYLQGTLSGLVGTGLVLMNGSEYSSGFSGPASNGTQVNFGAAFFNSTYALTIQSQPTNPAQTCVITNGSGTAGNADVTNIAVTCTTNPPRFAYVVNRGSNDISAYSINPATGTLAVIAGSPFATFAVLPPVRIFRLGQLCGRRENVLPPLQLPCKTQTIKQAGKRAAPVPWKASPALRGTENEPIHSPLRRLRGLCIPQHQDGPTFGPGDGAPLL